MALKHSYSGDTPGWLFAAFLLLAQLSALPVEAGDAPLPVQVADPYIELHTGPGRGYPIFHVEERGDRIDILKRKTDWFKVRAGRGKVGWVQRSQMERTLSLSGEPTRFKDATIAEFARHRWELGALGGDFEGANVISLLGGFALTPHMYVEMELSKVLADFSDSNVATLGLVSLPFPGWRFSPFFTVGTGVIQTDPKATLVQARDQTDQTGYVGAGLRVYLTRRFVFRAQYRNYVIFQSKDDNQEINEWKAGFAVFF